MQQQHDQNAHMCDEQNQERKQENNCDDTVNKALQMQKSHSVSSSCGRSLSAAASTNASSVSTTTDAEDLQAVRGIPSFDRLIASATRDPSFLVLIAQTPKLSTTKYTKKAAKCIMKIVYECYKQQLPVAATIATTSNMERQKWLQNGSSSQLFFTSTLDDRRSLKFVPDKNPQDYYSAGFTSISHGLQSATDYTTAQIQSTSTIVRSMQLNLQVSRERTEASMICYHFLCY